MWVCKFGGSSLRDAKSFENCLEILQENALRKIVVVSAVYSVTNILESAFVHAKAGDLKKSKARLCDYLKLHKKICDDLGLDIETYKKIDALYKKGFDWVEGLASPRLKGDENPNYLYHLGELASSVILDELCRKREISSRLVMATDFMKTDDAFPCASPRPLDIKAACKLCFPSNFKGVFITQGFLGRGAEGPTTLGREGSDYSGTLIAHALNAPKVEIWKDVLGVYISDPAICSSSRPFSKLSFYYASLMASWGAKVLFPKTLSPLMKTKSVVVLRSFNDLSHEGTCLTGEDIEHEFNVAGPLFMKGKVEGSRFIKAEEGELCRGKDKTHTLVSFIFFKRGLGDLDSSLLFQKMKKICSYHYDQGERVSLAFDNSKSKEYILLSSKLSEELNRP